MVITKTTRNQAAYYGVIWNLQNSNQYKWRITGSNCHLSRSLAKKSRKKSISYKFRVVASHINHQLVTGHGYGVEQWARCYCSWKSGTLSCWWHLQEEKKRPTNQLNETIKESTIMNMHEAIKFNGRPVCVGAFIQTVRVKGCVMIW